VIRTFFRRLFEKPAAMLQPGTPAAAFEAVVQDGRTVTSAQLAGKRYILWFYPKADTPG
jgi:peroxiredoxin Q/BCP